MLNENNNYLSIKLRLSSFLMDSRVLFCGFKEPLMNLSVCV
jgi:hypothetical protein